MSAAGIADLLQHMREHPSFKEMLDKMQPPKMELFKPSKQESVEEQTAKWMHRSGLHQQHVRWLEFLTQWNPQSGENEPSQQEKS